MLAGPVTVLFWRRVGGWVQQWFATRPATDAQIAGAIRAAEQVLARRRQRMEEGRPPRFAFGRRLWAMGVGQLLLGYFAVFALVSLMDEVLAGTGALGGVGMSYPGSLGLRHPSLEGKG